ncbi:MAG: SIR2 family protein [bacterium]
MSNIDFSKEQILFIANEQIDIERDYKESDDNFDVLKIREKIEPWLTAVFQSEHLSLLIGIGLTNAVMNMTGNKAQDMSRIEFECKYKENIKKTADNEAKKLDRGEANFEDDLRVASDLLKALNILENKEKENLNIEINGKLLSLLEGILKNENDFIESSEKLEALKTLKRFLISFSARTATRDRLNIFTTNYNRFIEYGLDESGILTLDRFIGKIKPIMRFHRIDLDYHYNPPGIRGEPRYVEGVVRYTKLHGSLDWRFYGGEIIKEPIFFGSKCNEKYFSDPLNNVVIYPNSSKAVETTYFPYSELFRDFSTAICRPNSVLVTYGYGFGDSHINRIIKDMLTIPSTHLVIISYDKVSGRIEKIVNGLNESQLTLLIGNHLGDFKTLTENYLPKSAIDRITERKHAILEKRGQIKRTDNPTDKTNFNNTEPED